MPAISTNDTSSQLALDDPIQALLQQYLTASRASSTRLAYQKDIQHFLQWGGTIPTTPEMVARYLAVHAASLAVATLARRLVAITHAHTQQHLASPAQDALVKATMQGIRRIKGQRQRQVLPLLKADIEQILSQLTGLQGARDKALLLIGFAGAFRRAELVSLQCEHLNFVGEGVIIHISRSKTDQEGHGRNIAIPRLNCPYCPVQALQQWLTLSGITAGYIFRSVGRYGQVQPQGLSAQSVALIIKRYASAAGLNAKEFSGHSLRAGLVTSAAKAGASPWKIRQQTGHQSDAMLQTYLRESQLFIDHPVGKIWSG